MNEWVNEWMNEWTSEWTNEWMNLLMWHNAAFLPWAHWQSQCQPHILHDCSCEIKNSIPVLSLNLKAVTHARCGLTLQQLLLLLLLSCPRLEIKADSPALLAPCWLRMLHLLSWGLRLSPAYYASRELNGGQLTELSPTLRLRLSNKLSAGQETAWCSNSIAGQTTGHRPLYCAETCA